MKQVSVTEYAKLHNISRQAVLKKIKTLDSKKVGNIWIITIK